MIVNCCYIRYIDNKFSDRQESTFQAHYCEKILNLGSKQVTLSIWDTAGQERFHALAPIYYRDASGAILVYDITDKTSFNKVQHWVHELRTVVGKDIVLIVSANKEDLQHKRQVNLSDAKEYANKVNAKVVATSAKTGNGVEELFLELTKKLLNQEQKNAQNNRNHGSRRNRPKTKIEVIDDTKYREKKDDCPCQLI